MTDAVLEEKRVDSDTPPDEHLHYFYESDLDENLLNGKVIFAMCGYKKEGLAHPNLDLPVCPACKDFYNHTKDE